MANRYRDFSDALRKAQQKDEIARDRLIAEAARRNLDLGDVIQNSSAYEKFRKRYRDDPVGFVCDVFKWRAGEGPTPYQRDILGNITVQKRVCVRGCHGLGKTALSSWAILWFALTRDVDSDWKSPITATSWNQLHLYLFREIRKWAGRIKWNIVGRDPFHPVRELQGHSLRLKTGDAFAIASSSSENIEGVHADCVFYVFDEAKAIPDEIWDGAEGAFSGENVASEAFAFAVSTPGKPEGRFYEIQTGRAGYQNWWVRAVLLQEAIKAKRISPTWVEEKKVQWGVKSSTYINRVEGQFAEGGDDGLIPAAWVEAAMVRGESMTPPDNVSPRNIGVDVARFGGDSTVIVFAKNGYVFDDLMDFQGLDTMEVVKEIQKVVTVGDRVAIDSRAVGAGAYDRLVELGYDVESVDASVGTELTDSTGKLHFFNLRAYLWYMMREMLDPNGTDLISLPRNDRLKRELITPKYDYAHNERIIVESKKDIKKRLGGKSTDYADAVMMALYLEKIGGSANGYLSMSQDW